MDGEAGGCVVNNCFVACAGPTWSARFPVPEELRLPSVTLTEAVSASYSAITPLLLPETVATPPANVVVVIDPNATAVPPLFVTVGLVTGPGLAGDGCAPEKVRFLLPA